MRKRPNRIFDCGDFCEIFLCDRKGEEIAKTLVDKKDLEIATKHIWSLSGLGYAANSEAGLLHLLIIGKKPGYITDHINRNKLDNRRKNLRYATVRENSLNYTKMRTLLGPWRGNRPLSDRAYLTPEINFMELYFRAIDILSPVLGVAEQIIYQRLLRLSYGNGEDCATSTFEDLAALCNVSISTLKRSLKELKRKNLVNISYQTKAPSIFKVFVPPTEKQENDRSFLTEKMISIPMSDNGSI